MVRTGFLGLARPVHKDLRKSGVRAAQGCAAELFPKPG